MPDATDVRANLGVTASVEPRVLGVAPTVGRVLHWVDGESKHRAAVVVSEPDVNGAFWINVLGAPGTTVSGWQSLFTQTTHEDATGKEIGSYHFPERV